MQPRQRGGPDHRYHLRLRFATTWLTVHNVSDSWVLIGVTMPAGPAVGPARVPSERLDTIWCRLTRRTEGLIGDRLGRHRWWPRGLSGNGHVVETGTPWKRTGSARWTKMDAMR